MAQTPLFSLSNVTLTFGSTPLFEGVEFALTRGERAALVGRNGAGKSTLMKIIQGQVTPDAGKVWHQPGVTVAAVAQEPSLDGFETLRDFATSGGAPAYAADAELMALDQDPLSDPKKLSGGQLRRAAIAKAFAEEPDVLLLDEPTNHLDVPAIEGLEARLKAFRGIILLVSHDRRFLENVTTTTLWLREKKVLKSPQGFGAFDKWAEGVESAEQKKLSRLNQQMKGEERWLLRGVTGRRARNQGRLTKMMEMRAQQSAMREQIHQSTLGADISSQTAQLTSKRAIEAIGVSKTYDTPNGEIIIADSIDIKIMRGDRIGIVGANGTGKTSLLKLLLGEEDADSGTIRRAKTLEMTYLSQHRNILNLDDTLWENLAPFGGDMIEVQGRQRHVAAYAKDFLFPKEQLRQSVSAMSGGERNRLSLAIGLARATNFLVLDEPTNDLDMQTLELLEDMLIDYEGTLLLVSHDRAFLDATVTSCLSPLGDGKWIQTPGGWSDSVRQLGDLLPSKKRSGKSSSGSNQNAERSKGKATKLSFKDTHRLKEIEEKLPLLQAKITQLEADLADPELYTRDIDAFERKSKELDSTHQAIAQMEEDWIEIEEKRESL